MQCNVSPVTTNAYLPVCQFAAVTVVTKPRITALRGSRSTDPGRQKRTLPNPKSATLTGHFMIFASAVINSGASRNWPQARTIAVETATIKPVTDLQGQDIWGDPLAVSGGRQARQESSKVPRITVASRSLHGSASLCIWKLNSAGVRYNETSSGWPRTFIYPCYFMKITG